MNKRRRKKLINQFASKMMRVTIEAWDKEGISDDERRRRLDSALAVLNECGHGAKA